MEQLMSLLLLADTDADGAATIALLVVSELRARLAGVGMIVLVKAAAEMHVAVAVGDSTLAGRLDMANKKCVVPQHNEGVLYDSPLSPPVSSIKFYVRAQC